MTKKEAMYLFYAYDLEPWYLSALDREVPESKRKLMSQKQIEKWCVNKFYEETKHTTKQAWEEELEKMGEI